MRCGLGTSFTEPAERDGEATTGRRPHLSTSPPSFQGKLVGGGVPRAQQSYKTTLVEAREKAAVQSDGPSP